jgi:hypothetical protein
MCWRQVLLMTFNTPGLGLYPETTLQSHKKDFTTLDLLALLMLNNIY